MFAVVVFQIKGEVADMDVVPKVVTPVEESMPLKSCNPLPICKVCTGEVPAPKRMPVRVVEPVPPLTGNVVAALTVSGKRRRAMRARSFFIYVKAKKVVPIGIYRVRQS